ncbi:hypothetical protein RJ639_024612 [Escallonia herrerae]|uniref:Transposase (putative) gypsy type domain-containing protein n=1 Tax=Escallonia herrerae TaxID=1293975 RepID=A0AA89ACJ3_9ASTE|nr:hypothetical protein RJ639_024612 [Escallonia herrerae]
MPVIPFQESKGVSVKKVLKENAQSPKPFDAHTLRSKLSSYDLKLLWERCEISPTIKLRLPDEGKSANMTAIDKISVYWDMFLNGFRVPLHPFFIKVLNAYGLAPGQFSPYAWSFISFFIYQCYKLGLRPRIRVFRLFFLLYVLYLGKWFGFRISTKRKKRAKMIMLNALMKSYVRLVFSSELTLDLCAKIMSSGIQWDSPLFNAWGVLGEIIPDELASVHGIEIQEMQDLDISALVSGSQPNVMQSAFIRMGLSRAYLPHSTQRYPCLTEERRSTDHEEAPRMPYNEKDIGFTRSSKILIWRNASSKMMSVELPVLTKMRLTWKVSIHRVMMRVSLCGRITSSRCFLCSLSVPSSPILLSIIGLDKLLEVSLDYEIFDFSLKDLAFFRRVTMVLVEVTIQLSIFSFSRSSHGFWPLEDALTLDLVKDVLARNVVRGA